MCYAVFAGQLRVLSPLVVSMLPSSPLSAMCVLSQRIMSLALSVPLIPGFAGLCLSVCHVPFSSPLAH